MSKSRRSFLKTVTAASVVSTIGNAAVFSQAYATQISNRYNTVTTDNLPSPGNTLGIVGDEVTSKFYSVSSDQTVFKYMANGYLTWALALSQQRLRIASNQAAPGATVKDSFYAQVEACIANGVTDIICMGGQNDLRQNTTLSDLQTAWTRVIARASAGAQRVWWLTQTPLNVSAPNATPAIRNTIAQLNTWILSQATTYPNVVVIDVTTPVAKTAQDNAMAWIDTYSADNVTPINVGAFYIGQAIAAKWTAAISNQFELATDPQDDIVGDPRSVNIVHNSLFTEGLGIASFDTLAGGSGYPAAGFDLVFNGGSGTGGAIAKAVVTNGVVTGMNIINPGSYTEAPSVSFEKGGGSGAAATLKLGPAGYANLNTSNITTLEDHPEGHGKLAKLTVAFPNYQYKGGFRYAYSMNRDIIKHIGPKDVFSVRCEIRRDPVADKLAAAGPAVQIYKGSLGRYYYSCGISADDKPLPSTVQFSAVFQTPPATVDNYSAVDLLLHVANDQSFATGTTGTVKVGRFSCLVQPSVTYTRAQKGIVNFHPGHYLNVYADWGYGHFASQDGFETGTATGGSPVTDTTAAWRGIEHPWYWKDLEPTKGDYKLDGIKNWLDALRNYKNKDGTPVAKYLLVYLLTDSYTRPAANSFPQYILEDPEYEGGVYQHNNGQGWKTRYDNPCIQDRLIALAQKIAETFDSDSVFEGFRIDETAPGDTLAQVLTDYNKAKNKNVTLTDYVEGQVRIAVEMNKAFKRSLFTIGYNYVADQKDTRLARMLVQAGVGMGAVDIVQIEPTLAGQYMSYDIIKSTSRFVPSLAHFDSLNYMSNGNVVQNVATVTDFAATRLHASHISWYRQWPSNLPNNYKQLVDYFNAKKTQSEWQSATGCTDGLNTVPPESIS
ncbi:SGNH/GDSL hydrolase family protein [Duganella callida]|uniref:SGNH/GDSL hydrolase family protein n=1 Tax=Duganella callida TaxID=2561932 RepID=A0A4Y9SL30_9BURK|nr:SGNH/GDSL hydrolase family protein [Duganella callida]TFW23862.1 SGNH/GDSL hydrolase family protein [Duganella callida]